MILQRYLFFAWALLMVVLPCVAEPPVADVTQYASIQNWLVCGSFPNPLAPGVTEYRHDETTLGYYVDYLKPVGGETGVQPTVGAAFEVDGKQYAWQAYTAPKDYVDFTKVLSENKNVVAYAACTLKSDKERDILLALGSNDGIKVWLNGGVVWDNHRPRGAERDQDYVPVHVRAGNNLLLIKVDQSGGGWGLYARVADRAEAEKAIRAEAVSSVDLETKIEANTLNVTLGRVSSLTILTPLPQYAAKLVNGEGKAVVEQQAPIGQRLTFDLASLKDGPYSVACTIAFPQGDLVRKTEFYKGQSHIRIVCDAKDRVEVLDKDFKPVLKAITQDPADSKARCMVRPDLAPFYLRWLVEMPGLGSRWFLADNDGKGFHCTPETVLDLPLYDEVLKTLYARTREQLKQDIPAWLKKDIKTRLRQATSRSLSVRERIGVLSTLTASVTSGTRDLDVWYAPGTEKVMRGGALPPVRHNVVHVALARNEYEPVQIVLRPRTDLNRLEATLDPVCGKNGAILPAESVSINAEGYVEVKTISDYFGSVAPWPDPLPPLAKSFDAKGGENTPLWITVFAPKNQPAGIYRTALRVRQDGKDLARIPIEITVFDVTLPDETHMRTAYGVTPDMKAYGSLSPAQQRALFDRYMQFCAAHRISPYTPQMYADFNIKFEGNPAHAVVDFAAFDEAMTRYLDTFHFNSFNMGGLPGKLNDAPQYSPEYNRLFADAYGKIQEHLRAKGWLDKAYWYWVDEPPKKEYSNVKRGMELLKASCPDIRRLLTCNQEDAPVPYFHNSVNLWVPIMDKYDTGRAHARQALGEEVWWYVCTGPKAPYPNDFIDHPSINHRIRFWMMDDLGLDGDLYWSVTYWEQNPWDQAMSVSPENSPWGNGDGRLLYPPRTASPADPAELGPVTSIRFENLRDGLEDSEYLIMLREAARTDAQAAALLASAFHTLVPSTVCYEQSSVAFAAYRHAIAGTLEHNK